jgi:hypothetical protein
VFDLRGFNLNAKLDIDPDFLKDDHHDHGHDHHDHDHEHGEHCDHPSHAHEGPRAPPPSRRRRQELRVQVRPRL